MIWKKAKPRGVGCLAKDGLGCKCVCYEDYEGLCKELCHWDESVMMIVWHDMVDDMVEFV